MNNENKTILASIKTSVEREAKKTSPWRKERECNLAEELELITEIGKTLEPRFVLGDSERTVYENIILWLHASKDAECVNPVNDKLVQADLTKGLYIGGPVGSGKTLCTEIFRLYCGAKVFPIAFAVDLSNPTAKVGDDKYRYIHWSDTQSQKICDYYAINGGTVEYEPGRRRILTIQDLGTEREFTDYRGNKTDVLRNLIEIRSTFANQMLIVTSNLALGGDALRTRYGERAASRLCEMCNYYPLGSPDHRLR